MGDDEVKKIALGKYILNAKKQRVVWARLTAVKRLLIRHGLTTHEDFEKMVTGMVNDINSKVEENVKKDLGLSEEEE